jgi:hypothetical protein
MARCAFGQLKRTKRINHRVDLAEFILKEVDDLRREEYH